VELCSTLLLCRRIIHEALGIFQRLVAAADAGLDSADMSHHALCVPDFHALACAAHPAATLDCSGRFSPTLSTVHLKRLLSMHCCRAIPGLHHVHFDGFRRQVAVQQVQYYGAISSTHQFYMALYHHFGMLLRFESFAAVSARKMGPMACAT